MKDRIKLLVCFAMLTSPVLTGMALAHTLTEETAATPEATGAPVAFVYVTRPTHLDGFAVSAAGKLTPVPGSPFTNISLSHLSVTKKFLFGASDDGKHIISYSIASNGSIKRVSSIDTTKVGNGQDIGCSPVGPTQIDPQGETLYNFQANCDDSAYVQAFKIESNGSLEFISVTQGTNEDAYVSAPAFLGNGSYAYLTGDDSNMGRENYAYKHESDGTLDYLDHATMNEPATKSSADMWIDSPFIASDPGNHVVTVQFQVNAHSGEADGPAVLLSYTAESNGNLVTTNTYKNAPTTTLFGPMSISPSGKLLAVGGSTSDKGLNLYHFNGASPITKYKGLLQPSEYFLQFGWDKSNHFYALSQNNLRIYNATPTSFSEPSGSPISIPEASSLIVLSLQ